MDRRGGINHFRHSRGGERVLEAIQQAWIDEVE
ncbi:Fe-S cluster assembly protein IscX [Chromobacterium amazonense]